MKKAVLLLTVLTLLMGCVFTGCGGGAKGGKAQIGYVTCNMNDLFQVFVKEAFEQYFADKADYTVVLQDAQEDTVKQQDQVNALIAQGVKALVVVPVDNSAMAPITTAATNAKIPLVYVNRNPFGESNPPSNVYYVGSQEIVGGRLQGEAMGKLLNGQGGVGILMGILNNEGAIKRTEGNEEVLGAQYPNVKVLDKQTGNWQPDQGLTIVQNWITAYGPNLNGILSNNDGMAMGAIEALKQAGREDVIVIGLDAIPDALAAVRGGSMAGTVLQDAKGQGAGAAEMALKAVQGVSQNPITWIPFVYIDKSNVAQY